MLCIDHLKICLQQTMKYSQNTIPVGNTNISHVIFSSADLESSILQHRGLKISYVCLNKTHGLFRFNELNHVC